MGKNKNGEDRAASARQSQNLGDKARKMPKGAGHKNGQAPK